MDNKLPLIASVYLMLFITSTNSHASKWSLLAEMLVSNDDAVNYGDFRDNRNLSSESDSALSYLVNVEYQWNDQFSTAFEFSDEQYQDLNGFDNHYHSLSFEYTDNYLNTDFSFNFSNLDIKLEEAELVLDILTPNYSYFLSNDSAAISGLDGVLLNLNLLLIDKSFNKGEYKNKNSKNAAIDLSIYYFFYNFKTYFSLSYNYANENAESFFIGKDRMDPYDYSQKTLTISTQKSFSFLEKKSKINLSYAIRKRDYTKVSSDSEDYRAFEDRDRIKIYFDTRLTPQWALRLSYDLKDRDSNLADYAYDNNLYSFRVQYQH